MKIGVLIPEFPAQTHMFFRRELDALHELGIDTETISTRLPPAAIMSHSWAKEATERTIYLAPRGIPDVASAIAELTATRPAGLARAAASIARADGLGFRGKGRLAALAATGARLRRVARDRGLSHVHVHSCADSAHIAMFAHLLGGPSYSITLHGPLSDYGPNQREKWRHAAFAVVITERLLEEVRQELAGSLPPIVEVAPMGVETERFVRSASYRPFSGDGPVRVFSCGRLNPCKGHSYLVRAIAELRARGFDARLDIAGEDELGGRGYHKELAAEIKREGLDHAVTLLGAVSEERVITGLEEAHVFALGSLAEPLGVAIMEAMALGTPVAVTGAGGVPELVRDGQDGLLVPPADAKALADAIERIARDENLAAKLASSARARVVSSFDSKRSASLIAKYVHQQPSATSVLSR